MAMPPRFCIPVAAAQRDAQKRSGGLKGWRPTRRARLWCTCPSQWVCEICGEGVPGAGTPSPFLAVALSSCFCKPPQNYPFLATLLPLNQATNEWLGLGASPAGW